MQNWETVRSVYMPGLLQIQTSMGVNPTAVWNSDPNPEDVQLWLPSEVPVAQRRAACVEGLPGMELQLRTGQCSSGLQGLRQTLRVKTRMIYFKNKNVRGQRDGTRSRSIIDRVHKRAIGFVKKYRAARQAKFSLEGPGAWEQTFRELRNEDIRGFSNGKPKKAPLRRGIWEDGHAPPAPEATGIFDEADESESDPDLDEPHEALPPKKKRKKGTGETRKELSWIWQTLPLRLDAADEEDDVLRAEWARSRARVRRATEEVMLLGEEMQRTLGFLEWRASWWEGRQGARSNVGAEMREGLHAFAVEQAAMQRSLAADFKKLWRTPLAEINRVLRGLQTTGPSDGESDSEIDGSDDGDDADSRDGGADGDGDDNDDDDGDGGDGNSSRGGDNGDGSEHS